MREKERGEVVSVWVTDATRRQSQLCQVIRNPEPLAKEKVTKTDLRYLYYILEFCVVLKDEFTLHFVQSKTFSGLTSERQICREWQIEFATCPTNYMGDPIADPETGHMSYIQ